MLLDELLRGSERVTALFGYNPFPHEPPSFVRTLVYKYEYARRWNCGGDWWRREVLGTIKHKTPLATQRALEARARRGDIAAVHMPRLQPQQVEKDEESSDDN